MTETTTRKPRTTRAKKETQTVQPIETVEVTKTVVTEQSKIIAPTKRVISDNDKVILLNNVYGRYVYNPKFGMPFRMVEYGDEVEITYEQLKNMYRNDRNHITKGYVYITDEDIVKELNLEKVYDYMFTKDEAIDLLENEEGLEEILNNMPEVMKETFLSFAYRSVKEGNLKNFGVIRTIKEITGVDITINTTFQDWN